jgi:hypothetical protein
MSLKRMFALVPSLFAAMALVALPVLSEAAKPVSPKANGGAKPTTPKGQSPRPSKPTSGKPTTVSTHGAPTTTAKAPKGPKAGGTTATTQTVRGNGKGNRTTDVASSGATTTNTSTSTSSTNTGTTDSGSNTDSTTTTTWRPNNPVAQKLSTKPNILNRVQGVLPAGTNLNAATAGFKNFGQFVAAVNVSNNLGIRFADLKAAMTGTTLAGQPTNQPTLSLGQAIQKYKGVDTTTATNTANTATAQANAEIASSPTTTTTTTSSTAKPNKNNKTGKSE